MVLLILICVTLSFLRPNLGIENNTEGNYKDMYVIKATTYQIGILTNETSQNNTTIGEQEAVTFYHKNGSDILSNIPAPLITNITGQRVVSVAPVDVLNSTASKPWLYLNNLLYGQNNTKGDRNVKDKRSVKGCDSNEDYNDPEKVNKRTVEDKSNKPLVKVIEGSAIIPQEVALKSINIPPLVTFKSNLTSIPVPIPNTSVVSYTKFNTVVSQN